MVSNDRSIELTFHYFKFFELLSVYRNTVKPIKFTIISPIVYSSSIIIWSFSLLDIISTSIYLFKPYSVDCWLICIILIGSALIDPETYPQVWLQIVSGLYPNRTYGFASPVGLWKVVARVPVFVIAPVDINTFIGFKSVTQVIQVWSCVGKFWPKGNK